MVKYSSMEMKPMSALSPLSIEGDMAVNWKRFKREFGTYIGAYFDGIKEKRKVAILLHHAGSDAQEIFESFQLSEEDQGKISVVLNCFDGYFVPVTNVTYERYMFFTRRQQEGESHDQFMTDLKKLSLTCDFADLRDSLVKDLFICGLSSSTLKKELLKLPEVNMQKALEHCRTQVAVENQVVNIKKESQSGSNILEEPSIDLLKSRWLQKRVTDNNPKGDLCKGDVGNMSKCKFCGYMAAAQFMVNRVMYAVEKINLPKCVAILQGKSGLIA